MRKLGPRYRGGGRAGRTGTFTILEIVVAMAIILVLAGLILATSSYVSNKAGRSRAEVEIAAMSSALENYKTDNGPIRRTLRSTRGQWAIQRDIRPPARHCSGTFLEISMAMDNLTLG